MFVGPAPYAPFRAPADKGPIVSRPPRLTIPALLFGLSLMMSRPAFAILRGDVNCDGAINGRDIQAWTDALLDPAKYAARYPNCSRCAADFNNDGLVDDNDKLLFIACLLNPIICLVHPPCFCPLPLVPGAAAPAPGADDPAFAVGSLADFNDRNVIRDGGTFPGIPADVLEQDGQQSSFGFPFGGQDAINGYDMSGRIRYPAGGGGGLNAPVAAGGPFPLVVIAHGNHTPFANAQGGDPPDENYRGYTYLQDRLATHGFISVSIDLDDFFALFPGILARAWLVQCAIEYMDRLNTAAGTLQGAIAINQASPANDRIALIGHSRGGEAVVQAVRLNGTLTGVGPGNTTGAFNIRAVFSLAATRFFDGTANWDIIIAPVGDPRQAVVSASVLTGAIPFLGMWGDADGDVSGPDSFTQPASAGGTAQRTTSNHVEGIYDGSTPGPKQFAWIEGANHNFWNTSWPGDDGSVAAMSVVTTRITAAQQRDLFSAYSVAFLRGYVRAQAAANDQAAYRNYFRFQPNQLSPGGVAAARAHLQYQEVAANRRTVDDFQANCALATTSTGQAGVATATLVGPAEGELIGAFDHPPTTPAGCPAALDSQSWYHNTRGLLAEWNAAADIYDSVTLAGMRDVSGFKTLSFRIAQDRRGAGAGGALVLDVQLVDGAGAAVTAKVRTNAITTIPAPQSRVDGFCSNNGVPCRVNANCGAGNTCDDVGLLTKSMLKTIRIPLCKFKEDRPALDLTNIVRVQFTNFDRAAGRFGIDDIEFSQ